MASAPPPYSTETSDSEIRIDATTPAHFQINNASQGDILGLRSQIMDNAPTLFLLAYNKHRLLTDVLRVNTIRVPHGENADKIFACIAGPSDAGGEPPILKMFIKGPPAESTESALRALLVKMEGMMGRLWEEGVQKGQVVRAKGFLRSIDE